MSHDTAQALWIPVTAGHGPRTLPHPALVPAVENHTHGAVWPHCPIARDPWRLEWGGLPARCEGCSLQLTHLLLDSHSRTDAVLDPRYLQLQPGGDQAACSMASSGLGARCRERTTIFLPFTGLLGEPWPSACPFTLYPYVPSPAISSALPSLSP